MNNLQIFDNPEFGQVRMIEIDGKPYAVGSDVAKALEYAIPHKAVRDHCKGVLTWNIPTSGGEQQVLVIPEGDIYRLIIKAADQSQNPRIQEKAERFERWLFDEVLPSIRQTGQYSTKIIPESLKNELLEHDPTSYLIVMQHTLPNNSPLTQEIQKIVAWHQELNANSIQCQVGFRNHKIGYVCFEELFKQYKIPIGYWYCVLKDSGYLNDIQTDYNIRRGPVFETHLTDKGRNIGGEEVKHAKKPKNKSGGLNYAYRFPELKILELFGRSMTSSDKELEELKKIAGAKVKDYTAPIAAVLETAEKYKNVRKLARLGWY